MTVETRHVVRPARYEYSYSVKITRRAWRGVNQECKKTRILRDFHFSNGPDRLQLNRPRFWWLNNNLGRLYVVLSLKEMCILFYLLFPRFCIISKQGPMHPLFSFGTCIWFDNFILEKLLLFIVFRNSTAALPARMHFPFSAPWRMHFNTESHILEIHISASQFYN